MMSKNEEKKKPHTRIRNKPRYCIHRTLFVDSNVFALACISLFSVIFRLCFVCLTHAAAFRKCFSSFVLYMEITNEH